MVKDLDWSDVEADAERMREEAAEQEANGLWENGTNDDVWNAIFGPGGLDIAGHLLERIERTDFTVGDLTNEQCVASILRRYPLLGPNPHFGR
jgi:hypothetical protein